MRSAPMYAPSNPWSTQKHWDGVSVLPSGRMAQAVLELLFLGRCLIRAVFSFFGGMLNIHQLISSDAYAQMAYSVHLSEAVTFYAGSNTSAFSPLLPSLGLAVLCWQELVLLLVQHCCGCLRKGPGLWRPSGSFCSFGAL